MLQLFFQSIIITQRVVKRWWTTLILTIIIKIEIIAKIKNLTFLKKKKKIVVLLLKVKDNIGTTFYIIYDWKLILLFLLIFLIIKGLIFF